jgi:GntR family transcriptional regulator
MPMIDPTDDAEEEADIRKSAASESLSFQPLDKTSFIPLPAQILAQLQGMIHSGRLAEGDLLPGEEQLSQAYGVSRPAARHALEMLRNLGFVVRKKGRGTFVTRPKVEKDIGHVEGFTAEMQRLGICAGARVLSACHRPAGADVAKRLAIFRGTPIFYLRRLRLAGSLPIAIEESCMELARFPGIDKLDFTDNSLYGVLREQYGVRFSRADEVLEAQAAGRAEARLLAVTPRSSLLLIRRTVWGVDGRPVEAADSYYRGDRYRAVLSIPGAASE